MGAGRGRILKFYFLKGGVGFFLLLSFRFAVLSLSSVVRHLLRGCFSTKVSVLFNDVNCDENPFFQQSYFRNSYHYGYTDNRCDSTDWSHSRRYSRPEVTKLKHAQLKNIYAGLYAQSKCGPGWIIHVAMFTRPVLDTDDTAVYILL